MFSFAGTVSLAKLGIAYQIHGCILWEGQIGFVPETIYTLASMTAPEASAHRGSVSQAHHDIIAFIAIIKSMPIISSSCHPRT
jgi:hypothetical protein